MAQTAGKTRRVGVNGKRDGRTAHSGSNGTGMTAVAPPTRKPEREHARKQVLAICSRDSKRRVFFKHTSGAMEKPSEHGDTEQTDD